MFLWQRQSPRLNSRQSPRFATEAKKWRCPGASRCRTGIQVSQRVGRVQRDDNCSNRHPAPAHWWSMIFSENRYPAPVASCSKASRQASARARRPQKSLFAQILERNLDALVVELLIVAAKLIAAVGAAMEKLAHHSDRSVRLTFEPGCAPNVDRAIEIKVVDIVKELPTSRPATGSLRMRSISARAPTGAMCS